MLNKALLVAMAGLVLIGSQAAADTNSSVLQAGDRAGSTPGASNDFSQNDVWLALLPQPRRANVYAIVGTHHKSPRQQRLIRRALRGFPLS